MANSQLSLNRVKELLAVAARARILVIGDVMLDQFIWGSVSRISPEAPVPIVEFSRENYMPGGAANVARNLSALNVQAELFSAIGEDSAGKALKALLSQQHVVCDGLIAVDSRPTSIKTRIVAHQQQLVRVDRESKQEIGTTDVQTILQAIEKSMDAADALIVGDYGKGVVTQPLLEGVKALCRCMRSASSITSSSTPVSSNPPRSVWSSNRPGVAISTSTPRVSLVS